MSGQQGRRSRGPPSPMFRGAASPWAPSPPPLISGQRHSAALVGGGAGSAGGAGRARTPNSPLPAPRPTWPHSPHAAGPSPFRRLHSPSPSVSISPYAASPIMCQSPEYFYSSPYDSEAGMGMGMGMAGMAGMAGVPLEPPRPMLYEDDEPRGPSTAEIIANQSQDYVDEKLAEYQATIHLLQGKMRFKFTPFLMRKEACVHFQTHVREQIRTKTKKLHTS